MTRPYAAVKLLEHGPLSFGEFVAVTGWKSHDAWLNLDRLIKRGAVTFLNQNGKRVCLLALK